MLQSSSSSSSSCGAICSRKVSYLGSPFLGVLCSSDRMCTFHAPHFPSESLQHFDRCRRIEPWLIVFAVCLQDMATEIILTLGEAFEVAYQIALRSQTAQVERTTPSTTEPPAGMGPPAGTTTPVSSTDARDDGVSRAESGQTSYRESTF